MFNQDYEHHINPIGTLISRYNGTVAQTQNLNFIIVNPFFPQLSLIKSRKERKLLKV
ncbi:MAG: hypothetical protein NWQ43_05490 [Dolichospermum sp.]|nr:hypothetical protein [Dolichospermum sp.]